MNAEKDVLFKKEQEIVLNYYYGESATGKKELVNDVWDFITEGKKTKKIQAILDSQKNHRIPVIRDTN